MAYSARLDLLYNLITHGAQLSKCNRPNNIFFVGKNALNSKPYMADAVIDDDDDVEMDERRRKKVLNGREWKMLKALYF